MLSLLNGCTLVGGGIGWALSPSADAPRLHRPMTQTASEFESKFDVAPGSQLALLLRSGKTYEGLYLGVREPTEEDPLSYVRLQTTGRGKGGRLSRPSFPSQSKPPVVLLVVSSRIVSVQLPAPTPTAAFVLGALGLTVDACLIVIAYAIGSATSNL